MNRRFTKAMKKHWQLYLFLLLPLIYIIVFAYIPMAGVQLAFKDFNPNLGIWGSEWVGFKYFEKFFNSYQFVRVLKNTLVLSLYSLIAGFPLPIIFALLLNAMRGTRYRKFVQTTTYIPHFISTVVMVGMILQILNPRVGLIAQLGNFLGIENMPNLMASPDTFKHVYVWSGIWQSLGWNTIIYMSALSASDAELHEAMQIDGATRFQRVRYLDFQCIKPTMIILLILNAGQIMNIGFEKVLLMQNDMNISASEIISTYVYKVGLSSATANFSYATAIGLFNSVINFILLIVVNKIARRTENQSLW